MNGFAIVIPVGPGNDEADRLSKLLRSIVRYEPEVSWIVLVDDDDSERHLERFCPIPASSKLIVLKNPRGNGGIPGPGGLLVGVMRGFEWVARHTTACFVLKLDVDSLVIAPFSDVINSALQRDSGIGQLGALGRTCNRNDPTYGHEVTLTSPIVQFSRLWDKIARQCSYSSVRLQEIGALSPKLRWCGSFVSVRKYVQAASNYGYERLVYCQGGGYVLAAEWLTRLSQEGCFDSYLAWVDVPINEDVVVSMYTHAVGLKVHDFSDRGEPFGVHWRGLPFAPVTMLSSGYSIIHSLKNNTAYTDDQIYGVFGDSAYHTRHDNRI